MPKKLCRCGLDKNHPGNCPPKKRRKPGQKVGDIIEDDPLTKEDIRQRKRDQEEEKKRR